MKIIKTYVALEMHCYSDQVATFTKRSCVDLSHGEESEIGESSPIKEEFATEEEAIEYAHKSNKYASWLILPKISFDNY